jgi:hypothetical protein
VDKIYAIADSEIEAGLDIAREKGVIDLDEKFCQGNSFP